MFAAIRRSTYPFGRIKWHLSLPGSSNKATTSSAGRVSDADRKVTRLTEDRLRLVSVLASGGGIRHKPNLEAGGTRKRAERSVGS